MEQSNKKFDVLIPVASKDTSFVKHVVTYINKFIIGCEKIYIVTNKNNFGRLGHLHTFPNVELLDENDLVPELNFGIVHECMNTISFFDGNQPLFTKKIENHEPYFNTMKRILGFGKLVDYSFIAEHMMFNVSIVNEMLEEIADSNNSDGETWVEKIMFACDFSDKRGNLFSEFETYGNYCVKFHPKLYATRQLNTFRAAGLISGRHLTHKALRRLALDVNIASFELQDAPFPYNMSWYMRRVKNKLRSITANLLNQTK